MYYTYILFSLKDSKLYIGYTNNLKRRFKQHSSGLVNSTKNRLPLKVIHYEYFLTKEEAKQREKYLKGGNGRKEIKILLFKTLKDLGYKYLN